MYLVNEKDLRGIEESEVRARLDIVDYLSDWAGEVFDEAKKRDTISLAGRYIRSEVLFKGDTLARLMDEVVLVDLGDFWRAVEGANGKRDDVSLYGIFCMIFSEVNEEMKLESKKLEGNIGYAPRLRFDISERRASEVDDTKKEKKGLLGGLLGKKTVQEVEEEEERDEELPVDLIGYQDGLDEEDENDSEEEGINLDEEIVEIDDKFVTPDNVNKLSILAVVLISILVVVLAWMILI